MALLLPHALRLPGHGREPDRLLAGRHPPASPLHPAPAPHGQALRHVRTGLGPGPQRRNHGPGPLLLLAPV